VAFLGVVLLIYGGEETGNISLFGCSLVLLAGIVFAACLRWTQRIIVQLTAQVYTTSSIVLGTITCLPFTLWLTQSWEIYWNWLGGGGRAAGEDFEGALTVGCAGGECRLEHGQFVVVGEKGSSSHVFIVVGD